MPHVIIEYSANLPDETWSIDDLLRVVVEAALGTGLFPIEGMRARAISCDHFLVGDVNSESGFLNISMRVGRGRSEAERMAAGKAIFEAAKEALRTLTGLRPVLLSFEMRELDDVKFNYRNN